MKLRGILLAAIALFLMVGCAFAFSVWTPALSADSSCDRMLARTEGYAPWRFQARSGAGGQATLSYTDGTNTANCQARQIGPVWITVGVEQTLVGCSLGLSDTADQGCPRGIYGVIH